MVARPLSSNFPVDMWGEDAGEQGDSWGEGSGLLESGPCHPPNSSCLLAPEDELPVVESIPPFPFVDVKQEVDTEDSMVTNLFLDSETADQDQPPAPF